MITIGQPKYIPVVLNLKGVGDLLIAIKVNGTSHHIVCTFTVPRKWPSLLDTDLIPDFWDNKLLDNLPQDEKGGNKLLADLPQDEKDGLITQIKNLRKTIQDYLSTVPF